MRATLRDYVMLFGFLAVMFYGGYAVGKYEALKPIPSCIYIKRPSLGEIKPLGYDNRQGVDADFTEIQGGGYYISLEKWKKQ